MAGNDQRAARAARDRRDVGERAKALYRRALIFGFEQCGDLRLVGKEHVDVVLEQIEKRFAMTVHAEGVGEREAYLAARCVRDARGLAERLLRVRWIEEIAFEVGNLRRLDQGDVDIVRCEIDARAEIGVHRALRIWGDEDQAERRRRPFRRCGSREGDAGLGDVAAVGFAERVVAYFADVPSRTAERCDSGDRVAGRPS